MTGDFTNNTNSTNNSVECTWSVSTTSTTADTLYFGSTVNVTDANYATYTPYIPSWGELSHPNSNSQENDRLKQENDRLSKRVAFLQEQMQEIDYAPNEKCARHLDLE